MIVVDTNVLLRGLRSRNGASFKILLGMLDGDLPFAATPAVVLEYEDVLKRPGILGSNRMSLAEIDAVLDAICAKAVPTFSWLRYRPFLDDPKDDLFVECALAAGARTIITSDRHFSHPALQAFGVNAVDAGEFLASRAEGMRR